MSEEKRPETYAELVTAFRQVLGEFEVWLQWGAVTNYAKSGGGSDDDLGGRRPVGEDNPPQDHWHKEWEHRGDRMKVWEEAREDLKRMRFGPPPEERPEVNPETLNELYARIVRDGAGWTVRDVENHFRVSSTIIREARRKAGVTADYGRTRKIIKAKNNKEWALQLAEVGHTEEQIEMITGVPKTSLRRAVGRSA